MEISVVIPAYNAEATIDATIQSVLAQTYAPKEILVLDDGSTDDTFVRLQAYASRITILRQSNRGVAHARNLLCARAQAEILAFLDADDLWHPNYLETQHNELIKKFPNAVAYFTGHENLLGLGDFVWKKGLLPRPPKPFLICPRKFIKICNKKPLHFQLSCGCFRRAVLLELGSELFRGIVGEDTYLHMLLPFKGSVVYAPQPLVAYRITPSSLSANRLKNSLMVVEVFDSLRKKYEAAKDPTIRKAFKLAYASRRRNCGKFLMGNGNKYEARREFSDSTKISYNPISVAKSVTLLLLTYLPGIFQPRWPSDQRPPTRT
jgi:glycosyltransferase involved in cell wall biosynthesis